MVPLLGLVCSGGGKFDRAHVDGANQVDGRSEERGMTTRGPFDPKYVKNEEDGDLVDEIEMQNLTTRKSEEDNHIHNHKEKEEKLQKSGLEEICHL